jgi:hypothetical protein
MRRKSRYSGLVRQPDNSQSIAPAQADYLLGKGGDGHEALKALATRLDLDLDTDDKRAFSTLGLLVASYYQGPTRLLGGQAAYVTANVAGTDNGHGMGLFRGEDTNKSFHFFDPNIGEYRIHDGKFVEFFGDYLALVKKHLLIEYEEAWGYPVSV